MANISHHDADILRSLLSISRSRGGPEVLTDIEELHSTFDSSERVNLIAKYHPTTLKSARRILKTHGRVSPVVEAARTGVVQVGSLINLVG